MNCLRCGRTIADDATFCDECLKTVRLPLQTSEFLSDRIILPVRTETERPEPARASEKKKTKKTEKAEKQPQKRPKGLIRAVVLLSLLCALLLGAGGYAASQYSDWLAEKNRVRVQQEEFDRLSARLAEAQSALTDEQERSRSLWQEVQTREDEIDGLKQDINTYRAQSAETDAAVQTLQDENLQLNQQLRDYIADVRSLEGTISYLRRSLQSANDSNAVLQEKSDFIDAHVVFIEDDGTKYYHTYDCSRFAKKGYWVYGRNTAEAKGYAPCPYCHDDD